MSDLSLPLTEPAYVFVVLFAIVLVAPLAAERARVPGIIGLLVAGVLAGPNVSGLLERPGAVEALGQIGLLYLMFLGGLDLDRDGFAEHRKDSVVFGAATFVTPMLVNTAVAVVLGLEILAAVLIASAFTSHTLVTYPLVARFGLIKNRAVTATLGATLISTVLALLVLAVVIAATEDETGPVFWAAFIAGLAAFFTAVVYGLPRLTRWFFAGLGQDRNVRFIYVLVVLFAASALADLIRIEAIVGAFLAGLALNRFVPDGSALEERLHFLGSSILIPIFLIATGMLVDPLALVREPRGLLVGLGLTASALLGKWLAAWPAAKALGFSRPELGLMFSLSTAQAGGALAAAIVAAEVDLIGPDEINAVILVILGTCLVAPFVGQRAAPKVERPRVRPGGLGKSVVVPIANPQSAAPLVEIAALVAAPDSGSVVPVNILSFQATREEVEAQREVTAGAEQIALRNGAEAKALVRIDASPTAGVLHTVVESGATCVLLGWKGFANARENFFGGVIDAVLGQVRVPVLVCRPGSDDEIKRVVLSVTAADLAPAGGPGLVLAAEVATRLARQAAVGLLVVSEVVEEELRDVFGEQQRRGVTLEILVDARKPPIALRTHSRAGDLVIIGTPPTRATLGQNASRVARAVSGRTVLATVPRGGA